MEDHIKREVLRLLEDFYSEADVAAFFCKNYLFKNNTKVAYMMNLVDTGKVSIKTMNCIPLLENVYELNPSDEASEAFLREILMLADKSPELTGHFMLRHWEMTPKYKEMQFS